MGLLTMLRLDMKHQVFPPKADMDADFGDIAIPIIPDPPAPAHGDRLAIRLWNRAGDRHLAQRDGR